MIKQTTEEPTTPNMTTGLAEAETLHYALFTFPSPQFLSNLKCLMDACMQLLYSNLSSRIPPKHYATWRLCYMTLNKHPPPHCPYFLKTLRSLPKVLLNFCWDISKEKPSHEYSSQIVHSFFGIFLQHNSPSSAAVISSLSDPPSLSIHYARLTSRM